MNNLSFDVIDALNERTTNILADSYEQVAAYVLDADEVRDAVVKYLLGDQILPVDPALHPKP